MIQINLRDYYPTCNNDILVEVTEEVAKQLVQICAMVKRTDSLSGHILQTCFQRLF